jgi:glycosyltransferase involved in cell wall biosynthesis
MKCCIQIPCFNEALTLPSVFRDLPKTCPGVDCIETLTIDDGSEDGTAATAERSGAHYIIRLPRNQGLAAAYVAGLRAALLCGADIIVNTDGDNQYSGADIVKLIEPIVSGRADIVVGDRQTDHIQHFSMLKRILQRWGTRLVRLAAGVEVHDATSGFRAMNRKAALAQVVRSRFSYTLETLIHAGELGLKVESVPVRTNGVTRPSRLFRSIPQYLRRSAVVIARAYLTYWPARTFGLVSLFFALLGTIGVGRFLWFYLADPNYNGHVQSLVAGVGCFTLGGIAAMLAAVGDLMAANRRLTEDVLRRVREMECRELRLWELRPGECREGVQRTFAPIWVATQEDVTNSDYARKEAESGSVDPAREQFEERCVVEPV